MILAAKLFIQIQILFLRLKTPEQRLQLWVVSQLAAQMLINLVLSEQIQHRLLPEVQRLLPCVLIPLN